MKKALVLLSGGMDSSVLLAQTQFEDFDTYALSINYGQRHSRELQSARAIAAKYGLGPGQKYFRVDLPTNVLASSGSSQVSETPVPEGSYTDESMKATVVPNRNMVFLAIAVSRALALGCEELRYAAHAGDHAIYPDCRPEFVAAMGDAIALCDETEVKLVAPFIQITKADIVQRGLQLRVPFNLTWTCYLGEDIACGRCGTCVERLEAFAKVGAEDPLAYRDRTFWQSAVEQVRR